MSTEIRNAQLAALDDWEKSIETKQIDLGLEHTKLIEVFCRQKGRHTFINSKVISSIPKYRSFGRGWVSDTTLESICIICRQTVRRESQSGDPRRCSSTASELEKILSGANEHRKIESTSSKRKQVIQDAAEQTHNIELQQTAKRLLDIDEELRRIESEDIPAYQKTAQEFCAKFGHEYVFEDRSHGSEILKVNCCRLCGNSYIIEQGHISDMTDW